MAILAFINDQMQLSSGYLNFYIFLLNCFFSLLGLFAPQSEDPNSHAVHEFLIVYLCLQSPHLCFDYVISVLLCFTSQLIVVS